MSLKIKHKFVSAKSDSSDLSLVNPSNWNDDHTLVGGEVFSDDYIFDPIAPAESLSSSLRIVTLPTVPLGINGTDTAHKLGIYDNSGVLQEVVLINGGSAVSGGTNQTLTFATVISNYTAGAYKIGSVSSGIQEAAIANPTGLVIVPAGVWPIYATIDLLNISLRGTGPTQTFLQVLFGDDKVLYIHDGAGTPEISSLQIFIDPSVAVKTLNSWLIYCYQTGPFIHHVQLRGGPVHIMFDSCPYGWVDNIFEGDHTIGIQVGNGPGHSSSIRISNVIATTANAGANWIYGRTGNVYVSQALSQISNPDVTGHVYISPDGATDGFGESQFSDLELDGGGGNSSIFVNPLNGANCFGFQFSNIMMTGGDNPGRGAISVVHTKNISFLNIQTRGVGLTGALIALSDVQNISFDNLNCGDFLGGVSSIAGISIIGAPVTDMAIRNSQIGYNSSGVEETAVTNAINWGSQPSTLVTLEGNSLFGNIATQTLVPADVSTWRAANNRGIKDIPATATAGSTLAFPFMDDGQLLVLAGATGVAAVSQLRKGQYGYIQSASAVIFTAGATIGNTFTLTAGGLNSFIFDGTKIWLK